MIKRNKCSVEGCTGLVWKEGKCQRHQPLPSSSISDVTHAKPLPPSIKKKMLKQFSEAGRKRREEKIALTKELHQFMFDWWRNLPSDKRLECWSCGKKLKDEFSTAYVDHLLEKSQYPDLAFKENNLFVCCLDCHGSKTNGFPLPKHKEAIDKVKQIFLYPLTPDDCYSQ